MNMANFFLQKKFRKTQTNNRFQLSCLENLQNSSYKYGFSTSISCESIEKGLTMDLIRRISKKKKKTNLF